GRRSPIAPNSRNAFRTSSGLIAARDPSEHLAEPSAPSSKDVTTHVRRGSRIRQARVRRTKSRKSRHVCHAGQDRGQDPHMQSPLDVFRHNILAGHVALVTGGGTGICRGIAHAYARFGADVCIVSRKADVLYKTASELSAATGRTILGHAADVRD